MTDEDASPTAMEAAGGWQERIGCIEDYIGGLYLLLLCYNLYSGSSTIVAVVCLCVSDDDVHLM